MRVYEFININLGKKQPKQVSANVQPDLVKREKRINRLTRQIARASNLQKPTQDEIKTAIERYETLQKRADYGYSKAIK